MQYPDLVRIVDVSGERLRRAEQTADGKQQSDGSDQLTAIVQYIAALAERQNIRRLRGPWMPPLPEHVPYHTVLKAPRFDGSTWISMQHRIMRSTAHRSPARRPSCTH